MKKLNNKGFSLVELIIVIAIMVILVVVIAPQYTKFVNNGKISADVQTADEIAVAINVAIAEGKTVSISGTTVTNCPNLAALPTSRFNETSWVVDFDAIEGVKSIELAGSEIWPDADAYKTAKGYK